MDLAPNQPYYLNNRGYYHIVQENWEAAEKDINLSIRGDSENPWAYRNKGILYYYEGRYNEALRNLQVSQQMDPEVEELANYIGLVLWRLDKQTEACDTWREGAAKGDQKAAIALAANCN